MYFELNKTLKKTNFNSVFWNCYYDNYYNRRRWVCKIQLISKI